MDSKFGLFYPAFMHSLVIGPKQVSTVNYGLMLLNYKRKSKLLSKVSVTNNNSNIYINENYY